MNALLSLYVYVKSMFEVEEGQDLIEYALIVGLLVIVVVASVAALGPTLESIWSTINSDLQGALGGS